MGLLLITKSLQLVLGFLLLTTNSSKASDFKDNSWLVVVAVAVDAGVASRSSLRVAVKA
jgi:hypothetical protein